MTMKKKIKTSSESEVPVSITTQLIPAAKGKKISITTARTNGSSTRTTGKTNGKNGKQKTDPASNGFNSHDLDRHELLRILAEIRNGNFTVRMPVDHTWINGKICDTLNDIIS